MGVDWHAVREEFPALRDWTYFNTATFGQIPRVAAEAINRHLAHRDETACADFLKWFDDADRIRGLAARLIHARAEDIAFVPTASSALSLFLQGLDWQPEDEILTIENEFPNQFYLPHVLASRGVILRTEPWSGFLAALRTKTRAIVISTVSYSTGFRPPLDQIAERIRGTGIRLFLDGTQSLGALQFDAAASGCDLFVTHGYKWLLCPTGAGFLYAPPRTRQWLAPFTYGWRSHRDWRNVTALHQGAPELPEDAERYEGGMLSFPLLYAMEASLRLILDIGPAIIERRVLELTAILRSRLAQLGADFPCPAASGWESPILCARFPGSSADHLVHELRKRGILLTSRHGALRLSVHFYNLEEDIDVLEKSLRELL